MSRRTAPAGVWTPEFVARAARELRHLDPVLGTAIDAIGPCPLLPEADHFPLLVRIIISQQISVKAARNIAERLRTSLPRQRFSPAALSRLPLENYRTAGLSGARAECVRGLAGAVASKQLGLARLARASDEQIHAALTALKGIGPWTVEMLLLFGHGRPDVFPEGDLGVRKAIGELYKFDGLPRPPACRAVAEVWRPYRSIATWYLWRYADKTGATLGLARYPV